MKTSATQKPGRVLRDTGKALSGFVPGGAELHEMIHPIGMDGVPVVNIQSGAIAGRAAFMHAYSCALVKFGEFVLSNSQELDLLKKALALDPQNEKLNKKKQKLQAVSSAVTKLMKAEKAAWADSDIGKAGQLFSEAIAQLSEVLAPKDRLIKYARARAAFLSR